MRETLTTLGELTGALLVAVAGWIVTPALGIFAAGIALAGFSWLASHTGPIEPGEPE